MTYKEVQKDLFTVNQNLKAGEQPYCLAHCISADFGMFGGIVVEFNKRWNMKNCLVSLYWNVQKEFKEYGGFCIPIKVTDDDKDTMVFNLITKDNVAVKPTYKDLELALKSMKKFMVTMGFKRLAIPLLGCGIDGLEWSTVSTTIQSIFLMSDIEILVCKR